MAGYFLPRPVHPVAWWVWALALATAASGTTNPLLLLGIIGVACLVTLSRRGDTPWAKGFVVYLILGAFVVVMRVAFRILFGGGDGPTVLIRLPEIPLPWWVAGIRLLGPVSLESLLTGLYDGLRLAAIIICVGAANSLANPKRLLASLPGALYELGTILVVAISIFPQLGDSVLRVRRVRRLRRTQAAKGTRARHQVVETIIVPVLSDALERSLQLAASMEVRGYGRHAAAGRTTRRLTTALGFLGVTLLLLGMFMLLGGTTLGPSIGGFKVVTIILLLAGVGLIAWSMLRGGQTVRKSQYRPIRWGPAEWLVVAAGAACALTLPLARRAGQAALLVPSINPPEVPALSALLLLGLVAGSLPAFATPAPSLAGARTPIPAEGLS